MALFYRIHKENRNATRDELSGLYLEFVDENANPKVIERLSEKEIKRLIAESVFDKYIKITYRSKSRLFERICLVVGISKSYMYKLRPTGSDEDKNDE